MAKKYHLSKDEQSQLHGIVPCFTFVVVKFVFIEEKFQAFMAYKWVFNLDTKSTPRYNTLLSIFLSN
jgi:hypothetical protein